MARCLGADDGVMAEGPDDERRRRIEHRCHIWRASIALGGLALVAALASCSSDSVGTAKSGARESTDSTSARSVLASKLPGVAAVGDGYRLRANSFTEPPEPFDPATTTTTTATRFNTVDRRCPGARWPRLDARPDVAGVEYVEFIGEDERELTVGLAPLPDSLDPDGMTALADAINECGTITDDEGFAVTTIALSAAPVEGVGDYGIDIRSTVDVAAAGEQPGAPTGPISKRTYLFVVGETLVAVVAENGFDIDQLATVTPDGDLVPAVARATAERLED